MVTCRDERDVVFVGGWERRAEPAGLSLLEVAPAASQHDLAAGLALEVAHNDLLQANRFARVSIDCLPFDPARSPQDHGQYPGRALILQIDSARDQIPDSLIGDSHPADQWR